ncbi:MAG TPA: hypothetical protein ENK01_00215 [Hellea balneolensis]|uniref:DUF4332 domain-containing protein n=1 Tax=Hellea balneolensis TaxID=287478 RepID=A0A7V5U0Q9_9PROT|nr:hypothetical protein [Hellea balneolensis]
MPLSTAEKDKILAVYNAGPKMLAYLESIGIESLAELAQHDASQLRFMINAELGKPHINALGERVLADIVRMARKTLTPAATNNN